jgi:hypothetical protein
LSYAQENHLPVARVKNRAGNWSEPTAAATTAAMQAFEEDLAKDVRAPIVDPPASAKDGYPICGLTYLLIPKTAKNPSKGKMEEFCAIYRDCRTKFRRKPGVRQVAIGLGRTRPEALGGSLRPISPGAGADRGSGRATVGSLRLASDIAMEPSAGL